MTMPESSSGSDIMTSPQVAQYLGIQSKETIRNWLEGGCFPGSFRGADGRWFFSKSCVEQVGVKMEALRRSKVRAPVYDQWS